MRKIKLEEISPYLPYGLKMIFTKSGRMGTLTGIQITENSELIFNFDLKYWKSLAIWNYKPILHPLSDLTKEIEHNGERFVPLHMLLENNHFNLSKMTDKDILGYLPVYQHIEMIPFSDIKLLFKWHFDLHNWLEDEIAVNINEL